MRCNLGEVRISPASSADAERGLIAWVRLDLGLLVLDGIALRRTLGGVFTLSFPERRDSQGRPHPYIRPKGDAARREIEAAVFAELRRIHGG